MTQKLHEKLASVLNLDEGAHPVEAGVRLDAADRTDRARDRAGRLLAPACHDDHVGGRPANAPAGRLAPQPVTYTRSCVRAARDAACGTSGALRA